MREERELLLVEAGEGVESKGERPEQVPAPAPLERIPVSPERVPASAPPERAWRRRGALNALARYYVPDVHGVWPGNDCRLLRDGIEAYPAMIDAIRAARRTVRLETYMFVDDVVGELFGRALAEAAARGVQVKVLYDALGSWGSKASFFAGLRAQGVDIQPFKPLSLSTGLFGLIRRDHRKILIVDGLVAFTGGVNISAKWAPAGQGEGWRDDVLRIEGPAVQQLERCFVASWRLQLAHKFRDLRRKRRPIPHRIMGDVPITVLSSRRSIHRAYLHAISRAKKSVMIAAAYFIPDRKMVAALREAALRGVEVKLILSGKSDHPFLTFGTRAFYDRLLDAGVQIHEWCHCVLHAKTAVIDGTWGTIGSFNLERISLWLNHEVNAVFADRRLGRELEESFERDCSACTAIEVGAWRRRPLWQKALEKVLYLFRKIL